MKLRIPIQVIEVMFYLIIGGIIGLIVGGSRPATIGTSTGLVIGAAAGIGWYLVYLFDKLMWETHSFVNRLIGSSIPFFGFGLVVMLVGDGIRYLAFQFYGGNNPVDYAFLGEKSQWTPEAEATRIDTPLYMIHPTKQGKVKSLQFLAGGNMLAATFDDRLEFYQADNGKKIADLGEVYAYDEEQKLAAYAEKGGTLCLYDITAGKGLWSKPTNDNPIKCITFSSDNRRMATGSKDGTVRIWDAANGDILGEFPQQGGAVLGVDISPDGSLLACGSIGGKVFVWDIDAGKLKWSLPIKLPSYWDPVRVTKVEFSRDGKSLVSVSIYQQDYRVQLWRMADGKELLRIPGVLFLGRMAATPDMEVILLYDIQSFHLGLNKTLDGKQLKTLPEKYHTFWVSISAEDGLIRFGTNEGRVVTWETDTNSFKEFRASAKMSVNSIACAAEAPLIVTGSSDQLVRLWQADSGALVATFEGHQKPIRCAAISPKGERVASGSVDNEIRVWQVGRSESNFNEVSR